MAPRPKRSSAATALLSGLLLFTAGGATASRAAATELAGVTMPAQRDFAGEELVLNGMGLRKKYFVKVYVGGLYLETHASDAQAILASDGAKAIVMHFVRGVDAATLVDAFREDFEKNAPERARAAGENKERFLALVPDVEDGTELAYAWIPGRGLLCLQDGEERATIDDRALADAVFASYLGPSPPTEDFKAGLLGR